MISNIISITNPHLWQAEVPKRILGQVLFFLNVYSTVTHCEPRSVPFVERACNLVVCFYIVHNTNVSEGIQNVVNIEWTAE